MTAITFFYPFAASLAALVLSASAPESRTENELVGGLLGGAAGAGIGAAFGGGEGAAFGGVACRQQDGTWRIVN